MLFESLLIQTGTTVSFVGAGGKTSLIFSLAYELSSCGYRVLVTTTTAMFHPKFLGLNRIMVVLGNEVLSCNKNVFTYNGCVIVAAHGYDKKNSKLIGYDPNYIILINELGFFDFILVEADGARMKSIKCPGAHEPVIPEVTSTVVGCIGLDCIGSQINHNNVHRPDFLLELCKDGNLNTISQDIIVTLVVSDGGLFKDVSRNTAKVVFLNKADNTNLVKNGKKIAFRIISTYSYISCVIVACLKDTIEPIKLVLQHGVK